MKSNRLIREKSPYLLQHAHNPVDWQAWGEEALREAQSEGKLIFLSVGYSTCHWCHVMEKESFEDPAVGEALRKGYVAIKVDREELPEVDAFYMSAVQAMTGQGGWPLSVFLTPDRKPFFGGTYFPKDRFLYVLEEIGRQWAADPARIRSAGEQLGRWFKEQASRATGAQVNDNLLFRYFSRQCEEFDPQHGGKSGAPKFPPAADLRLLLRIHRRSGDPRALEMVKMTLNRMSAGGIYDALGGGFHRYSTDEKWAVPHFEKMLYDQAAMSSALTEAYLATHDRELELVLRETLDYVLREMTAPEGGFYSAEDADSEGEEGRFYVWTEAELKRGLSPGEMEPLREAYGITERGNFEGNSNILILQPGHTRVNRSEPLRAVLSKLKAARDQRIRPLRDEKVIVAWNALMISALARAARALDEERYFEAAAKAARFLLAHCRGAENRLFRRWVGGEARFEACAEDYAFLIEALIELNQFDFDPNWLETACELQGVQDARYWDKSRGGYFTAAEETGAMPLPMRQREFFDNVLPSANSVSAFNLLRIGALTGDAARDERFEALCRALPSELEAYPWVFPQLLLAFDWRLDDAKEISVPADGPPELKQDFLRRLRTEFLPNLVCKLEPGQAIRICRRGACDAPRSEAASALESARGFTRLELN